MIGACLCVIVTTSPAALAQVASPVYVDDSPATTEGIDRIRDHLSKGDADKADRLLQKLLLEEGEHLIATPGDADLFVSVRDRLHQALLASPALLEAHRRLQGPTAARLLAEGQDASVEESYLLTTAGFDAAIRVAQRQLEAAQFQAARRTLMQLERHPDRKAQRARQAARLLALVARYLDAPDVWDDVQRWRTEAGEPTTERKPESKPLIQLGLSTLDQAPPIDLSDMIAQPFWSEPLSIAPEDDEESASPTPRRTDEVAPSARLLHIAPTVAGDTVYVNDSQAISAWDRFTMTLRWRVRFTPNGLDPRLRRRTNAIGRLAIEDLNTVSVYGPWVVATTGLARQGQRDGDGRLHALDARTGVVRWSVDPAKLSPALADSSLRGPALIDQSTVVALAIKQVKQRRLVSANLVGLDLATGALRWTRLLASRGTLPFASTGQMIDPPMIDKGVVYDADALGFVTAIDAVTGRLLWLRRLSADVSRVVPGVAWQTAPPALINGTLYALAPDRNTLLALDASTGVILSRRSAEQFVRARYLLHAGSTLLVVGDRTVFALETDRFDNAGAQPRRIIDLPAPGMRGRVVVAGDSIVAPTTDGLVLSPLDAVDAAQQRSVELDKPGAILPVEGQLVVVDDDATHSYLIWSVAERILSRRMLESPLDPVPAATYAELAHRAGRLDRLVEAVDSALTAIEADPLKRQNKATRARLFESVHAMIEPDPKKTPRIFLEGAVAGELVDRLGRLASTPDERLMHLLTLGAYQERESSPRLAIGAYQRILDDPILTEVSVTRHSTPINGEIEATKRLRNLLKLYGRDLYAAFDEEARLALASAGDSIDPDLFTSIARRYPVSTAAADAWLRAGIAYVGRGRPHGAIHAWEKGLAAAEFALSSDDPVIEELAGRLVHALARAGRTSAAAETLARLLKKRPTLTLKDNDVTIDAPALLQSLTQQLNTLDRRARIGLLKENPATSMLKGWTITRPLLEPASAVAAKVIAMASDDQLGFWGVDEQGDLTQRWTIDADEGLALLAITSDAVYIARSDDDGRVVLKIDSSSGETLWTTTPFAEVFGSKLVGVNPASDSQIETPLHALRPLHELLVAMDEHTIALVERTGRAAAFDLDAGRTSWTNPAIMTLVYDIDARGGVLLVGGASTPDNDLNRHAPRAPTLVALDLRTGQSLHVLPAKAGQIRWVRLSPEGDALAGMEDGVASFDLFHGWIRWMATGDAARQTLDAWLFPGRIITLSPRGELWQIESEDGASSSRNLETRRRILPNMRTISAARLGDHAVFVSPAGMVIFDRRGQLVGMDSRAGLPTLLPASFGEKRLVTIDQSPSGRSDKGAEYDVSLCTASSCALEQRRAVLLEAPPSDIAIVDSHIIISAGDASIIISAPPAASAAPTDASSPGTQP